MSGLGEWDDTAPVYDLSDAPEVDVEEEGDEAPVATITGQVSPALDVATIASGLVSATLTAEIRKQVQRQVAPIVKAAVEAVLTPERLHALRRTATAAAKAELKPSLEQPAGEELPVLYYGSVDEFVREFVCPVFRRNVGEEGRADYRWSSRWWESAEAITRLEAMWRSWEHLRIDASTGTSVWLRDHADHHLGVLMSPTGPWALSRDAADPADPLPYEAPPEGLFPDVRKS